MNFYIWFIKIKLSLQEKLNYKRLTYKYLNKKRLQAKEEIKHLKHFTHWPIAKPKNKTNNYSLKVKTDQQESIQTYSQQSYVEIKLRNKAKFLPFYAYRRKPHPHRLFLNKESNESTHINKFNGIKKHH